MFCYDPYALCFMNKDCNAKAGTNKVPLLLYIIIITAPDKYLQREAIRNSWVKTLINNNSMKYAFFIGDIGISKLQMDAVKEEIDKFRDIVILDDVDEVYTKLSRKVLQAFAWTYRYIDAVYYLKTDDDCFIVIDNLYATLTNGNLVTKKLIFGKIAKFYRVLRDGKWAEPNWFLCGIYLPYSLGLGYIITQDVVNYLTGNSNRLMHYNNEDTSLGSWIAPLELEYVNEDRILNLVYPSPCETAIWLIHGCDPKDMIDIQSSMLNGTDICDWWYNSYY
ncbi:Beta-1,3-galactosyltransferase 6-like [Oopsacas minuta]|uniref:Hexosyltransferase n=1 Tax=Oopsacas minuta TaxID=111878 RepID=A0AAV7K0U3_9METZ|nr:Beta-1,3-galactosyltransferase 6-like [Oopsacas minuta]